MSETPVVLCADDYAMNGGIDEAILDLAARGRISATSCMTNAPGWPAAAARLRELDGRIGVGLHLTLTWGAPLGRMPGLAPDRAFPTLGRLLSRSSRGGFGPGEVAAEVARQLRAFVAALGRPPDFVDGHQHVHVLPGIRGPLLGVLAGAGLGGRLWLRDPSDRPASILARRLSAGKALFVGALATGFRAGAERAGFTANRGFSGFGPFDPGRDPGPDMAAHLDALGPAPVVMCHPGVESPADAADEIAAARHREAAYLCSSAFADLLARRAISLVPAPRERAA